MEHVDDECDQDHSHQDVDKTADIRGVASFGQQEPFELFFSICHLPDNKRRRHEAGVGLLTCVLSVA